MKHGSAAELVNGSVGELADPIDSKSIASEEACEFNSRLSYKFEQVL